MVRVESKYGIYGIMELLPMEYLREFARGKDPSMKAKNKATLIEELINRHYVADQDLNNFNNYYEDIINKETIKSASIVKLSESPVVSAVLEFLKENKYEYEADNEIVSKDGFDITSVSPLRFDYWYDNKKLIRNPDNSIKEEHNTGKVEIEYDKNSEVLFFYTHDVRKVSKVMNYLVNGKNLDIAAQRKSLSLEDSYKRFQDLLNKLDETVESHNNNPPYKHVISLIRLFDAAQKNVIKKIFYESQVDILNDKEIEDKRKQGYFLIGIGGYLYFNNTKYSFKISFSKEYLKWGDALTIYTEASTNNGPQYINDVFDTLRQLVMGILIQYGAP